MPHDPVSDHSEVAESINSSTHYAMYSVFRVGTPLPSQRDRAHAAAALEQQFAEIDDLTIRGWYDVSGLRGDADVMVWWWAERIETLQRAYHTLQSGEIGNCLAPVWSVAAVHRAAEFNTRHVPAFLAGDPAREYLCVYPFVRSYEWYLLDDTERSALLREHGRAARDFPDVLANTMSGFALGDYEWILAFEADDLVRIVDLMRELRATGARRHVREEVPFFTGPRVTLSALIAALP